MAEKETGAETATEQETAPSMEETAAAAFEAVEAREAAETATETTETATPPKGAQRGPDGKFIASAETAAAETTETTESTESPDTASETASEAETPIVAPPSMSAAEKTEFAKLPPAMQAFVARRESEGALGLQQKTQAISETKRRYDSLDQVLAPRRQQFALNGVTEAQAINQLLALSDFATRDINGFLKYMAEQRGVDLKALIDQPGQQATPVDPVLAETRKTVQDLQRTIQQMTSGQEQALQQHVTSEIETFRTAKGTNGQSLHPHFDAVRETMGILMQAPNSKLDLQGAYDAAVHANPTTRAQLAAEQRTADEVKRKAAEAKRVADARKAQGTVLTPKATTPGKPAVKSMEETAREAYDRINGAAA